jgi:hypothetical protein
VDRSQRQSQEIALNRATSFGILAQPDETTCGPTCLHAVYRYYGERAELNRIIREVPALRDGGTLAVFLAIHALRRGFKARIYTYNLQMFDPTWFDREGVDLRERLVAQLKHKRDDRLDQATEGYLEFLDLGGELRYEDLTTALVRKHLNRNQPLLTGLSATYLYREARERPTDCKPDDLLGLPSGHFVVLCDYDRENRHVIVADPLHKNPFSPKRLYPARIDRVLGAVLLGMITYDANLLVLEPPIPQTDRKAKSRGESYRRR